MNKIELRHGERLTKPSPHVVFVCVGSGVRWADIRRYPVDVFRRRWNVAQQSLVSHAVVAFAVIDRDVALVGPENVHMIPIDAPTEGTRRRSS